MTGPLAHRPFRLLVTARTVNTLGNAVAPLALAFAVLDLTGSVSALGLIVGARSLANVVFVLLGGVLADRLPRPLVLVGSNALSALTQATVAALVLTGTAHVPALLVLSALNGALAALSQPASAALTPQTVPPDARQQANALLRLGGNGSNIVGAAAGGALVAALGPGWGLVVDAASFAVAALVFAGLRVPSTPTRGARTSMLADLRDGWSEFSSRTWLWVVVAAFSVINTAFGAMLVLGPAVADRTIGRGGWGLVSASETAGMVLGSVFAIRSRARHPLFGAMLWMTVFPALIAGIALAPHLGVLIALGLLCGVGVEQFGVAWETTMQAQVPEEKLARVYSYDMLGSFLAIPVGEMVAGPVAAATGTTVTLLGAAALALMAALAAALTPSVRRLRRLPAPEPVAV